MSLMDWQLRCILPRPGLPERTCTELSVHVLSDNERQGAHCWHTLLGSRGPQSQETCRGYRQNRAHAKTQSSPGKPCWAQCTASSMESTLVLLIITCCSMHKKFQIGHNAMVHVPRPSWATPATAFGVLLLCRCPLLVCYRGRPVSCA